MIRYMILGAWVLILVAVGIVISVVSDENMDESERFGYSSGKLLYILAVMLTFYGIGEHIGGL